MRSTFTVKLDHNHNVSTHAQYSPTAMAQTTSVTGYKLQCDTALSFYCTPVRAPRSYFRSSSTGIRHHSPMWHLRREATPYRNGLRLAGAIDVTPEVKTREELVVRQRRNLALAKQRREREATDRAQRTKPQKRRTKGGGVRANMERAGLIKNNKRQ
jgi:hypothetical protein